MKKGPVPWLIAFVAYFSTCVHSFSRLVGLCDNSLWKSQLVEGSEITLGQ